LAVVKHSPQLVSELVAAPAHTKADSGPAPVATAF